MIVTIERLAVPPALGLLGLGILALLVINGALGSRVRRFVWDGRVGQKLGGLGFVALLLGASALALLGAWLLSGPRRASATDRARCREVYAADLSNYVQESRADGTYSEEVEQSLLEALRSC